MAILCVFLINSLYVVHKSLQNFFIAIPIWLERTMYSIEFIKQHTCQEVLASFALYKGLSATLGRTGEGGKVMVELDGDGMKMDVDI